MRRVFRLICITAAVPVLGWAAVAFGGPESSSSAARQRSEPQRTGRWMLACRISGVSETALARGADRSKSFELECIVVRDGERLDVTTTRREGGLPVRAWRSIINGWYVSYEVPPPGKAAGRGLYATNGSAFGGAALPSGWGAFEGYAAGDYVRYSEVLESAARVVSSAEQIDGCPCLHLTADSPKYGNYQLWLDPAADHLPRRIVVQKAAGDYWGDKPLDQWTQLIPRGSRGTVALQGITYTLDQVKLERVEGRWFPLACRVTRVHRYADGNLETTVMDCRRTRLQLDPQSPSPEPFVPELRRGARLSNQIDPHLPYQWDGSAPVPLVDKGLVAAMDRTARVLSQDMARNKEGGR